MPPEPTKAAEVKPQEPKPIERSFVSDYLTELKNKIMSYAGKIGYNPYTWWQNTGMKEMEELFNAGNTEQGLYKRILSTAFSEPTVSNPTKINLKGKIAGT